MNWCVFCQQVVDSNSIVCGSCREYKGLVLADTCPRCLGYKQKGSLCVDCYGRPRDPQTLSAQKHPATYDFHRLEPGDEIQLVTPGEDLETRLYDLTRKQNRTTWENEELARLRAEWKAKKGYDYV